MTTVGAVKPVVGKVKHRVKDAIWNKNWTPEQVKNYVGTYQRCYFTYAADTELRGNAASGGSTSALLVYMLQSGQIDGALVLGSKIENGGVRPEFFIARTREEVMAAQGSKYAAVFFAATALPQIKAFEGRLAVVALPCDAKILHQYRLKHPEIDEKIKLVITLTCGHNSEPELTRLVVQKLNREEHGDLSDYRFREGHWRGQLKAQFEDGTQVVKPFSYFSDYQNLYFFAQQKCHHCFDHFGYYSDISSGDIWSPRMKVNPVKHTALITRTDRGQALVEAALQAGALCGQQEPIDEVLDGQARTMPFHYNVTSRARLGKRLAGVNIKARTEEKVRLVDYAIAALALINERVYRTKTGKAIIMRLPRPVLKAYLFLFKLLESF